MTAQDPDVDPQIEVFLRNVPRPSARSEFRERLRRDFVNVVPAAAAPAASGGAPPRRREPFRFRWALAAGLLIALGFLLFRSPRPRWEALEVGAGTIVRADGVTVNVDDRAALARALEEADQIHVETGELVLRVGDVALFGFGPNTRARIRGIGDSGKPVELIVESGRLRASTGPGFEGRSMHVDADLFGATITGTAFAVDYEEHGTCLCCLHGSVTMESKVIPPDSKAGSETILPERMCLIYREEREREPKRGAHPKHHHEPLVKVDGLARDLWPPR